MVLGIDPIGNIIKDYGSKYKSLHNAVLSAHPTWHNQIESCVRGLHKTNSGFKLGHMHQNRIKKIIKDAAIKALSKATYPPSYVKDFEDLFEWVFKVLQSNRVINNRCVWVYDIAMRMGQCMSPKIEPKDYVYLYKGAYRGAVELNKILPTGNKIKIVNHRAPVISFPPILQTEGAIHIENIMCIYHPKK